MKAWYDDIDSATLQRIKTYSAFNDAMSKNLMVQTMYEYREKEVQDFKETNHELAETCIARKKRIAELEKENAELKKEVEKHKWNDIFLEESAFYDKKIAEEYTTLQERIAELEKENAELKGKLKTAYRKGMRHMAKALKDYDRTDGAWTDYFEHTVDKVLQREQLDFEEYGTLAEQLTKAKEIIKMLHSDCYSIAECEDTNLGLWEDDLAKAEQFLKGE